MGFEIALAIIVIIVVLFFGTIILFLSRYRKCPSDQVLVIYGKVGNSHDGSTRSSKCIHGGAAFIWPVIQAYEYLDLTPISIQVDLKSALSRQNIRIDVPSRFTVGISTETGVIQNAAERLLGLKHSDVQELAKDILFGQLRLVVATMDIEEINTNREKFLEAVSLNVESELKKIGLRLINVNVTDISDESGYIEALGKEAAAQAINDAKRSVAEKDRDGTVGQAEAQKDQRVRVSVANSIAVKGENEAQMEIASSNATLREREAEAEKRANASEKVQAAQALAEAYSAEKSAELVRAEREKATYEANIIVKAEIEKRQLEIEAEATAEQTRRVARGEADALYAKMEAEARGTEAILRAQAAGMLQIITAANGDVDGAVKMMITDKLQDIVDVQAKAISNLKIDKVTVWDGGNTENGKTQTANFASGLLKSLPPLSDIYSMAGLDMPSFISPKKEKAY